VAPEYAPALRSGAKLTARARSRFFRSSKALPPRRPVIAAPADTGGGGQSPFLPCEQALQGNLANEDWPADLLLLQSVEVERMGGGAIFTAKNAVKITKKKRSNRQAAAPGSPKHHGRAPWPVHKTRQP